MAINPNVLSFVAGAAEQFTKTNDVLKKELRENKRRQRDWMNTDGNKVLNERKRKEEAVTSALKQLESRGLQQPDVLQLMQRHGVEAVLQLQKYVNEYESENDTTVDADLINKVWKAADDFTLTSDNYDDALSKVFGTYKVASAAPVIQEAEDRNFFDILKRNLSGAYEDEEYADFLDDPTEGIGNQSINDLRRMAAASPSMLGTEGSAVFDRSQLRGIDSTSADRNQWNIARSDIVLNAVMSLTQEERRAITQDLDGENPSTRNTQNQFSLLKLKHSEALAEATRKYVEGGIDLSNNPAAWSAYGGQNALNDILNPLTLEEQLAEKGTSEEETQLIVNNPFVKTDNTQADIEKIREFLEANPNLPYVIIDNKIMESEDFLSRSEEGNSEGGGEEGSADTPEIPTQQSLIKAVEKRPPLRSKDQDALKLHREWNKKYKGKYNPKTGEAIIVEKRPTEAPTNRPIYSPQASLDDIQKAWDKKYKNTHDAETGYPIGYVLINAEAGN